MILWNDRGFRELIDKRTHKLLEDCSLFVMREAKLRCPVLTGNLRRSISREIKGDTAKVGTTAKSGNGTRGYGFYVEMGHKTRSGSHVDEKPFLRPALDALNQRAINDILKKI